MKNFGWKLLALTLLLILIGVFFYENTTTTSNIYLWVTSVQVKTWQLILTMFFLGGLTFCLVPITLKFRKKNSISGTGETDSVTTSNKESNFEEKTDKSSDSSEKEQTSDID